VFAGPTGRHGDPERPYCKYDASVVDRISLDLTEGKRGSICKGSGRTEDEAEEESREEIDIYTWGPIYKISRDKLTTNL